MTSQTDMERLIAQLNYRADSSLRDRVARRLEQAWSDRKDAGSSTSGCRVVWLSGRLVRRLAVAAAVLAVVAVGIHSWDRSMPPAYALDQTAAAVSEIRCFHFQALSNEGSVDREAWVEYDLDGRIKKIRVNFYLLKQVVVWMDGITHYWPYGNDLVTFEDQEYTDRMVFFAQRYNPRGAVEYLRQLEAAGKVRIDTTQPGRPAEPVTVTVTYEPNTFVIGEPKPPMKEIFHIDSSTKLITDVDVYVLSQDKGCARARIWQYLDYNQPFSNSRFDLDAEVPPHVNRVDLTGVPMGIEQGDLSEQKIADIVVRDFVQAWIVGDFDKAILIHGYTDPGQPSALRQQLQRSQPRAVASISPPRPPEAPKKGLIVRCTLDSDTQGVASQVEYEFLVNEGPKGRWRIRDFHPIESPNSPAR
jgi:hypothetical protein